MKRTQINTRLTERHQNMLDELAEIYGSVSSALRIAIENEYRRAKMYKPTHKNVSERYGEQEQATLEDYQELNQDGRFEVDHNGNIVEYFSDGPGDWEIVAEPK